MIAECLIIKDESRYLLEHLTYNAAAGIDHFFIYDNMSRTPVWEYLRENAPDLMQICTFERYIGRGNTQIDCYADYLQKWRGEVEWSLFCDADECFTGNIRDAVAEFGSDYNCLSFAPILHGCNGKIYDDGGGMFERFGGDIIDPAHHWYKFAARTADIVSISNVHYCKMSGKKMVYLTADNYPQCVLHHFRYRSFEEWLRKISRGRALRPPQNDKHIIKDFFDANPKVSPTDPEVVALMQKHGVNLETVQKYFDVSRENVLQCEK